ncbi:two pore domain potassium channel family protein [Parashewanella curva]|uniref:two pore domain potassium channel family protein n=1 Tax=Parashewanella curva TaxID=2338552 RepID=UPI0014053C93|nr:two pore domain potassium channel family protein [Parashewanella curva]
MLTTILLMIAFIPFSVYLPYSGYFISIIMSVFLLFAVYTVSQNKRTFLIGVFLAVPTFISSWALNITNSEDAIFINNVTNIIFIGFITLVLMNVVFKAKKITGDIIAGSICIYLLLGFLWSFIYVLCDLIVPNSFTMKSNSIDSRYDYFYFSFVTLTSLGYGDISPNNAFSETFAMLEAIVGQIYLTVMVAWLVGVHVSQHEAAD